MQVAPSPPAIARRPVAPLAALLVCRPVLLASQGTTPGDERGYAATLNDPQQGMADMSKKFLDMGVEVYVDQAAVVKESNKVL
jgi:hypothetical protein